MKRSFFSINRFLPSPLKCNPPPPQPMARVHYVILSFIMISMQFGHQSLTIPSQFPFSLRLQYPSFPSLILQIASSSPPPSSDCLANPFAPVVDAIELFRRCRNPSVSRVTFSYHNTGGSVPSLLRTLCSSSRRILMSSASDIFPTSCNFRSSRNLESV